MHIVLAGCGHAHLETVVNLELFLNKGIKVSVVSENTRHYYSGMAPGYIGGTYTKEEISFDIKSMIEKKGGIFIKDQVIKTNPNKKELILKNSQNINYDIISFNTGSIINPLNITDSENVFNVKPIYELIKLKECLFQFSFKDKINICIAGAGPAGIEISCAIDYFLRKRGIKNYKIILVSGNSFLRGFSKSSCKKVKKILISKNIEISDSIIEKIHKNRVYTDKKDFYSDIIVCASGIKISDIFKESGIGGFDDGLLVGKTLNSPYYPYIFGGGDCISFKDKRLNKVGVYAVRQGPVLMQNLYSHALRKDLISFNPQEKYLKILNLGCRSGLLEKNNFSFYGKPAFFIKNFIDKKFMKKYKVFE